MVPKANNIADFKIHLSIISNSTVPVSLYQQRSNIYWKSFSKLHISTVTPIADC